MTDKPDFDALRATRDDALSKLLDAVCAERGFDRAAMLVHVSGGCYCACADGGPCEHEFAGWRDFADGRGGEQFCQKCGLGAMAHSLKSDYGRCNFHASGR